MGKITFTYAKYNFIIDEGRPMYNNNNVDIDALPGYLSNLKNPSSINISAVKCNTWVGNHKCDSLEIVLNGDDEALKKAIDNIVDAFGLPYTIAQPFTFKIPRFIRKNLGPFETEPSTKEVYKHLVSKTKEKKIHYTSMKYGVLELGYQF